MKQMYSDDRRSSNRITEEEEERDANEKKHTPTRKESDFKRNFQQDRISLNQCYSGKTRQLIRKMQHKKKKGVWFENDVTLARAFGK
jgi:hypothetical protein